MTVINGKGISGSALPVHEETTTPASRLKSKDSGDYLEERWQRKKQEEARRAEEAIDLRLEPRGEKNI